MKARSSSRIVVRNVVSLVLQHDSYKLMGYATMYNITFHSAATRHTRLLLHQWVAKWAVKLNKLKHWTTPIVGSMVIGNNDAARLFTVFSSS